MNLQSPISILPCRKVQVLKRWLFLICLLAMACRNVDSATEDVLTVDEESIVGQTLAEGEAVVLPEVATATLVVPTVLVPSVTPVGLETAVSPYPAPDPNATPTAIANTFPPGSQAAFPLDVGEIISFRFDGTRFVPLLFFAEASEGLDVVVQVYEGDDISVAPLSEANFSGTGLPELLVFSSEVTGLHRIAVAGLAGSGEARLFALAGGERDALAPGESRTYGVVSKNGRPVIAFVDPVEQADLVITFTSNGSVVAEANFSGAGSAEAAFVLPRQTTEYNVTISEASGAAAAYDVVIVALE